MLYTIVDTISYTVVREVEPLSEKDKDKVIMDSESVKVTYHRGVRKTRIPKRIFQRPDLKNFFAGDLEIRLVLDTETNEKYLEIRTVNEQK